MFHAEFELTNHCNTRCLQCPHETMTRPKGRLSRPTFDTVVSKIREYCAGQVYSLSFSGMGEPLLHPELCEFVRSVSHEARTSFATNGAALTSDNVRRLIDAGLDEIYFSFNGEDPATYERMMGGLRFDRALANLRHAIALSEGTRLRISANISVTKANRHQLTGITELLRREGVSRLSYSMAHTRGGNLRDPEVVDTPPIPKEITHCEVVRNTLFIDWRGRVMICDHDLHADHSLGDLTMEPLEVIQHRREQLIRDGVSFPICGVCSDVLKMGTNLFDDLRSGTLRDWVYDVYRAEHNEAPLPDAAPKHRWLYTLYAREGRVARMVNGLLKRITLLESDLRWHKERLAQVEGGFTEARETLDRLNGEARSLAKRVQELDVLVRERERRIQQLEAERQHTHSQWCWPLLRLEACLRRAWSGTKPNRPGS